MRKSPANEKKRNQAIEALRQIQEVERWAEREQITDAEEVGDQMLNETLAESVDNIRKAIHASLSDLAESEALHATVVAHELAAC